MDRKSMKLLRALDKRDLPEDEVNKIIENGNFNRKVLSQLLSANMISKHGSGGIPDGEGGHQHGTVKWTYRIEPNGRAEVDHARKSRLLWLIGTGIALLAAIGAILSGLSSWVS